MSHRSVRAAVVSLGSSVLLAGLALPASAVAGQDHETVRPDAAVEPQPVTSFKAGYTSAPPGDVIYSASSTFVLPEVQCRTRHDAVSIGLGSEPQWGVVDYLATVWLSCRGGEPYYLLTAYLGGGIPRQPEASAGDKIRVSMKQDANNVRTVRVVDLTTGERSRLSGQADEPLPNDDVDFGMFPLFAGGDITRVPEFVPVALRRNKLASEAGGSRCVEASTAVPNTRADGETGELEIDTGDLTRCHFRLRYVSH